MGRSASRGLTGEKVDVRQRIPRSLPLHACPRSPIRVVGGSVHLSHCYVLQEGHASLTVPRLASNLPPDRALEGARNMGDQDAVLQHERAHVVYPARAAVLYWIGHSVCSPYAALLSATERLIFSKDIQICTATIKLIYGRSRAKENSDVKQKSLDRTSHRQTLLLYLSSVAMLYTTILRCDTAIRTEIALLKAVSSWQGSSQDERLQDLLMDLGKLQQTHSIRCYLLEIHLGGAHSSGVMTASAAVSEMQDIVMAIQSSLIKLRDRHS